MKRLKRRRLALAYKGPEIWAILSEEELAYYNVCSGEFKIEKSSKKKNDNILEESTTWLGVNVNSEEKSEVELLKVIQDILSKNLVKFNNSAEKLYKKNKRDLTQEEFFGLLKKMGNNVKKDVTERGLLP